MKAVRLSAASRSENLHAEEYHLALSVELIARDFELCGRVGRLVHLRLRPNFSLAVHRGLKGMRIWVPFFLQDRKDLL